MTPPVDKLSADDRTRPPTHAEAGIASCLVGVIMLLVQLGVFMALAGGLKDSQGTIYVFTVPFFTYLIGVPLGLALALIGFCQKGRKRLFAILGVCLTLAGPLIFVLDGYRRLPSRTSAALPALADTVEDEYWTVRQKTVNVNIFYRR